MADMKLARVVKASSQKDGSESPLSKSEKAAVEAAMHMVHSVMDQHGLDLLEFASGNVVKRPKITR